MRRLLSHPSTPGAPYAQQALRRAHHNNHLLHHHHHSSSSVSSPLLLSQSFSSFLVHHAPEMKSKQPNNNNNNKDDSIDNRKRSKKKPPTVPITTNLSNAFLISSQQQDDGAAAATTTTSSKKIRPKRFLYIKPRTLTQPSQPSSSSTTTTTSEEGTLPLRNLRTTTKIKKTKRSINNNNNNNRSLDVVENNNDSKSNQSNDSDLSTTQKTQKLNQIKEQQQHGAKNLSKPRNTLTSVNDDNNHHRMLMDEEKENDEENSNDDDDATVEMMEKKSSSEAKMGHIYRWISSLDSKFTLDMIMEHLIMSNHAKDAVELFVREALYEKGVLHSQVNASTFSSLLISLASEREIPCILQLFGLAPCREDFKMITHRFARKTSVETLGIMFKHIVYLTGSRNVQIAKYLFYGKVVQHCLSRAMEQEKQHRRNDAQNNEEVSPDSDHIDSVESFITFFCRTMFQNEQFRDVIYTYRMKQNENLRFNLEMYQLVIESFSAINDKKGMHEVFSLVQRQFSEKEYNRYYAFRSMVSKNDTKLELSSLYSRAIDAMNHSLSSAKPILQERRVRLSETTATNLFRCCSNVNDFKNVCAFTQKFIIPSLSTITDEDLMISIADAAYISYDYNLEVAFAAVLENIGFCIQSKLLNIMLKMYSISDPTVLRTCDSIVREMPNNSLPHKKKIQLLELLIQLYNERGLYFKSESIYFETILPHCTFGESFNIFKSLVSEAIRKKDSEMLINLANSLPDSNYAKTADLYIVETCCNQYVHDIAIEYCTTIFSYSNDRALNMEILYERLLNALCDRREEDLIVKGTKLRFIRSSAYSVGLCNALMRAHLLCNQVAEAVSLLKKMKSIKNTKGLLLMGPTTTTYNLLLETLINLNREQDALMILSEMKQTNETTPDLQTYKLFIDYYMEKGIHEKSMTYLLQATEYFSNNHQTHDLKPHDYMNIGYGLVDALIKKDYKSGFQLIMACLSKAGLSTDAKLYEIYILNAYHQQNQELALDLFEQIPHDIVPTKQTYDVIGYIYITKRRLNEASHIYHELFMKHILQNDAGKKPASTWKDYCLENITHALSGGLENSGMPLITAVTKLENLIESLLESSWVDAAWDAYFALWPSNLPPTFKLLKLLSRNVRHSLDRKEVLLVYYRLLEVEDAMNIIYNDHSMLEVKREALNNLLQICLKEQRLSDCFRVATHLKSNDIPISLLNLITLSRYCESAKTKGFTELFEFS